MGCCCNRLHFAGFTYCGHTVRENFDNLKKKFFFLYQMFPPLINRVQIYKMVSNISQINPMPLGENLGVLDRFFALTRTVAGATHNFFLQSRFVAKALALTKFLSGSLFPFCIYNTCQAAGKFHKALDRFDSCQIFLDFLANLSTIGETFSTSIIGMTELGWIPVIAFTLVKPIFAASVVLSLAGVISKAMGWWESKKVLQTCSEKLEKDPNGEEVFKFLNSMPNRGIKKHFRIKGSEIKHHFQRAYTITDEANQNNFKKRTITLLITRLNAKIWENRIAVTASIVGLIGFTLLVLTSMATMGYILLSIGIVSGMVNFSSKNRNDFLLKKRLRQLIA